MSESHDEDPRDEDEDDEDEDEDMEEDEAEERERGLTPRQARVLQDAFARMRLEDVRLRLGDACVLVEETAHFRMLSPSTTHQPIPFVMPCGTVTRYLAFVGLKDVEEELWAEVEAFAPLIHSAHEVREPGVYSWLAYLRKSDSALSFVCAHVYSSLATGVKHAALFRRLMDRGIAEYDCPVVLAGELLVSDRGERRFNFSSGCARWPQDKHRPAAASRRTT
eukprot:TRINITY_DN365_c0_g1_i1.p1 TRINITY_DN365_c0_g1~~TRINITY_DN365_c0_g1_i1.p1  ORF type:complete len:239 (-),score=58.66 TRINITY_DN365_c0_g1_i1:996-1661(-)